MRILIPLMVLLGLSACNIGTGATRDDDSVVGDDDTTAEASPTPSLNPIMSGEVGVASATTVTLDVYGIGLEQGDILGVVADNDAQGSGDPVVFLVNGSGTIVATFEDEGACSVTPSVGGAAACPQGAYTAEANDANFGVAVGMWTGSSDAPAYHLQVNLDGAPQYLTLDLDDVTVPLGR